jgi:uncharacterized protein (TIGR03067 family)
MRYWVLIASCLFFQAAGAVRAPGDVDEDRKQLQGDWRALELQTSGNAAPKDVVEKARVEVTGDQMVWHSGGKVVRKSRLRLHPGKSPKEIDITVLDGPGKGTTYLGIYSLEKGRLRLCYSHTKDRPTEFRTERGQLRELVILERVKPK